MQKVYQKVAKKSKYRAIKTVVDGITFASKKEAKRYGELKLLEKAGLINNLSLQVRYVIDVGRTHICNYIADFTYWESAVDSAANTATSKLVVEDVKGMRTREYKLKKKLMLAVYGIEIREV